MRASKVLEKALTILETDGWCQYTIRDSKGRHCALDAISAALGTQFRIANNAMYADAYLRTAIQATSKYLTPSISAWNDYPKRTFTQVREAFTTACSLAMSEGE